MTYTKCDLSAGIAKLDIEILTKQVEIHFYKLVNDIRQKMSDIQYETLSVEKRKENVFKMTASGANDIINLSKNLAETAELLHTLQEKTERKIEIV